MRLVLTPASILLIITPIYLLQTPRERAKLQSTGGVTNISITSELLWFIIPAMTAQSIFLVVMMVQETVEPSTWEKAKKSANKAMGVASICEMIAVYKLGRMVLSPVADLGLRIMIEEYHISSPTPLKEVFTLRLTRMSKPMLTPALIFLITAINQIRPPRGFTKSEGVTNISKTSELLWFIITAMTAQSIYLVVKTVQKSVQPSTWEKVKKYASKAISVASIGEMISVYKFASYCAKSQLVVVCF
ncbi:hypothetical protein LXL04_016305 [Taraxacum kok-saghyz]